MIKVSSLRPRFGYIYQKSETPGKKVPKVTTLLNAFSSHKNLSLIDNVLL